MNNSTWRLTIWSFINFDQDFEHIDSLVWKQLLTRHPQKKYKWKLGKKTSESSINLMNDVQGLSCCYFSPFQFPFIRAYCYLHNLINHLQEGF